MGYFMFNLMIGSHGANDNVKESREVGVLRNGEKRRVVKGFPNDRAKRLETQSIEV